MIVTYPNKADWLEARRGVLTATQAAILWTSHMGGKIWPGSSPWDVWAEKAGEKEDDLEENVHLWLGKALELPICEWVAGEVAPSIGPGVELSYPAPFTMWTRNDRPFMAATPDATLSNGGVPIALVEAKTASYPDDWGDTGTPMVPMNYLAQATWQMAVCELPMCYVGVYLCYAVEGFKRPKTVKERRWYRLERIAAVEQVMIDVCEKWWQAHVETGFPPPREHKLRRVS